MPPDATATKKRLLDAAYDEFAQFGLAGARVDRIGAAAKANKRLIYVHFGVKEELFDVVVARAMATFVEAVPFTVDDLGGYAGALFDHLLDDPRMLRLNIWAQLERPKPTAAELDQYRGKVATVAAAQRGGTLAWEADPVDVLALILGLIVAWAGASPALRSLAPEEPWSPERIRGHRGALVAAVRTLTQSTSASTTPG
jgi:AcrR family transcriptional regulator